MRTPTSLDDAWKRRVAASVLSSLTDARCQRCVVSHKFSSRFHHRHRLAVWLSGNALASIIVVALRQTRLVLGWVTVCGRVNHFGM